MPSPSLMDSVGHSGTHAPQAIHSSVIFMDMVVTPFAGIYCNRDVTCRCESQAKQSPQTGDCFGPSFDFAALRSGRKPSQRHTTSTAPLIFQLFPHMRPICPAPSEPQEQEPWLRSHLKEVFPIVQYAIALPSILFQDGPFLPQD